MCDELVNNYSNEGMKSRERERQKQVEHVSLNEEGWINMREMESSVIAFIWITWDRVLG